MPSVVLVGPDLVGVDSLELCRRMEAGEDITTIPGIWVKESGVVHRNEIGERSPGIDPYADPHAAPFQHREDDTKGRFDLRPRGLSAR